MLPLLEACWALQTELIISNVTQGLVENVQADRQFAFGRKIRARFVAFLTNRRVVRVTLVALNVAILAGIVAFVFRGAQTDQVLTQKATLPSLNSVQDQPLDQISSADIAVTVASVAGLSHEVTAVTNQAQSAAADLTVAPADTTVVAKPQTVATTFASNKDIKPYVVAAGDTVSSIAAKFNVTSDSIMWSNNLSGNTVNAGTKLVIPPINGIVYTVQANDTPDTLASKYHADKTQIIEVNDIELTGLKAGTQILIPNATQPVVTLTRISLTATYGPYNGYDYGFCTWYAAKRRADIGRPVPSNLGNANTWASIAAAFGIATGATPQVGAVAVKHAAAPGHVAVVEAVNADGSFWISEMNSYGQRSMTDSTPTGGWGVVDWKMISADGAGSYTYVY